jgi:hypothetical protein
MRQANKRQAERQKFCACLRLAFTMSLGEGRNISPQVKWTPHHRHTVTNTFNAIACSTLSMQTTPDVFNK